MSPHLPASRGWGRQPRRSRTARFRRGAPSGCSTARRSLRWRLARTLPTLRWDAGDGAMSAAAARERGTGPGMNGSRLAGAALVALALAGVAAPAAGDGLGVAVIVGNRTYADERVPEVAYAHNDAEAFKRFVTGRLGFDADNVIDLRDATKAELESWFGARGNARGLLWRRVDPSGGSDVVVFYSGHGVPGSGGGGYLLPADSNPDAAELNGYPIDLLYENLGGLRTRSATVYLDACFSGNSPGGTLIRSASPVYVEADLPGAAAGLTVLTAASGAQMASWDEGSGHGLFTEHLLDGLYGAADADGDGRVTAREAKGHLDRTMTHAARREFGREQDAGLHGDGGAVLSVAPTGGWGSRPRLPRAAFTVAVTPAAAQVRILNVGAPYRAGMELAAGSYEVEASAEGYETGRETVAHGTVPTTHRMALSRLGQPFTVVTAPVPARVRLVDHADAYRPGMLLPPGSYRVEVSAEGYEMTVESVPHGTGPTMRRIALRKSGDRFRDCPECPEMVVVPAGSYRMGRQRRQHEVTIAAPFAVGKYEVTFAEWDACVRGRGCPQGERVADDQGWGRGQRPVIHLSWNDAKRYVQWLSRKTKKGYRLLSESEWEYAARAGTETAYSWGDEIGVNRANCIGCGGKWSEFSVEFHSEFARMTAPVGSFAANAWGLHDMHGNVYEWVEDCWNRSYEGSPADGSAWLRGNCDRRVLRGGAWNREPKYLRAAYRIWGVIATRRNTEYHFRDDKLGFRVARRLALSRPGQPFTIMPEPAHTRVRLVDHAETYRPGMVLPPGSYRVEARAEGYETAAARVQHGAAGPTVRRIALRRTGPKAGSTAGDWFRDCPECPEMVVLPAGSFMMGSPSGEEGRYIHEGPVHEVTFERPFAVGKYEVTFAEWDACVRGRGCPQGERVADDQGWGRGQRPVLNVSWDDAKRYVQWLSRKTKKAYRLLSESEWEYAARAGTETAYSWGDEIGTNRANCDGCGGQWYEFSVEFHSEFARMTAPVGSFAANAWGLHDMHGNVHEWVEDCWNGSYEGSPVDGSAWLRGDCDSREVRGGSWINPPRKLRSAFTSAAPTGDHFYYLGFRVAQTLTP